MKSLYTFSYDDYLQNVHAYLMLTYLFRLIFFQWSL